MVHVVTLRVFPSSFQVSGWSSWGDCPCQSSATIPLQSRTKRVTQPPGFNGKCGVDVHGPLTDTRICRSPPSACAKSYSTKCNDRGINIFLDRHPIDCAEGRAIQRFELRPCEGNKMRYDYTCVDININPDVDITYLAKDTEDNDYGMGSTCKKHCQGNDYGEGSIFYLDRHKVDCQNNGVLQRFTLKNSGNSKMRYNIGGGLWNEEWPETEPGMI